MPVAFLLLWLFVLLPLTEAIHSYFYQQSGWHDVRRINPLRWYLDFWKLLKQRGAFVLPTSILIVRKIFIFILLSLALMGLFVLVLEKGSLDTVALVFVLAFLFLMGLALLGLGFTMRQPLVKQASLDSVFVRQSMLLIVALAVFATPTPSQVHFGALLNPIAFLCTCFAITLTIRSNYVHLTSQPSVLRSSLQGELVGTDLLSFRLFNAIECVLLDCIVVLVFLTQRQDTIWVFTAKIFSVELICASAHHLMPPFSTRQVIRVLYLILFGFTLLSFFFALWVKEMMTFSL